MIIAFVIYPGITALDIIGPYEVLHSLDNIETCFVADKAGPIMTDSGVLALGATHSFEEMPNPDIVIVPGSSASTMTAMANGRLIRYLQKVHKQTQFTISVCSGALILASAGILEGVPATTHWLLMDSLTKFGAKPQPNARFVREGKIITAAGVSAGIDMALMLVAELRDKQTAKVHQLLLEYDPQPPFNAGHPSKADTETKKLAIQFAKENWRKAHNILSLSVVLARRWRQNFR